METNPIHSSPDDVKSALLKEGWIPGHYRIAVPESSLTIGDVVLRELFNIKLPPLTQDGPYLPVPIFFNPTIAVGCEREINQLQSIVRKQLYAIAEVDAAVAIMLISETGEIFILGYAEPGVLYGGKNFGEALANILHGRPVPCLMPHPQMCSIPKLFAVSSGDAVVGIIQEDGSISFDKNCPKRIASTLTTSRVQNLPPQNLPGIL